MGVLTFDQWLNIGIEQGWCGPSVCSVHDGVPTSFFEDSEFDEGSDPCVFVVRLYEDAAMREAVEMNHSPSVWRKPR
jgi:hypothetical protein